MRLKQEIEKILRRQTGLVPSEKMTDMVNSVCTAIDNLLWEKKQNKDREMEMQGQERTAHQVNIAVDGPCGGGKTTLGAILRELYDCNVFHMDDFFLRPEQRTSMRYLEPGGNVDYERFKAEVIDHLSDKEGLEYRRFDCGTMRLGDRQRVPYKSLNIIEGSYSCHPYFGEDIYALQFYVDIEPDRQRERIIARSGEMMWKRFETEWIPMENKYFDSLEIRRKCVVIEMNL